VRIGRWDSVVFNVVVLFVLFLCWQSLIHFVVDFRHKSIVVVVVVPVVNRVVGPNYILYIIKETWKTNRGVRFKFIR